MPVQRSAIRLAIISIIAALLSVSGAFGISPAQAASPTEIVLEFEVTADEATAGGNAVRGEVGLGGDLAGVTINWGDTASGSNVTTVPDGTGVASQFYAHSFSAAGTYTVTISGTTLTQFGHCDSFPENYVNLKKIVSWSSDTLTSLSCMAAYRSGLTQIPTSLPNANIESLDHAFYLAAIFNQDLSTWLTTSVTNMNSVFEGAGSFNNGGHTLVWDTSNVTEMGYMFSYAGTFNQPLTFDTSGVGNMAGMFSNAGNFNQDLLTWDTSNVYYFNRMFSGATSFNGELAGLWSVEGGGDFTDMFNGATSFNQDLSAWDTSAAVLMPRMFNNAQSFDQTLGAWDISQVQSLTDFLTDSGMSDAQYTDTIIGWASQTVQADAQLGAPGKRVVGCAAAAARQTLIDAPNNWTITDNAPLLPAGGCSGDSSADSNTLASTGTNTATVLVFALGGIGLGIVVLLVIFVIRRRKL